MNTALTPEECVEHVLDKVDRWIEQSICETCALRFLSIEYDIEYRKLVAMYLARRDAVQ